MTSTLQDRLRDMLPGLPAELQRAARWALDNPAEVGLWSMRRQAQAVGVAPATMLRMARAAGCDTYEAFRAPFQRALTQGMEAGWRDRAARLQARRAETPAVDARAALTRWQTAALESIGAVNADSAFDEAAATLLAARQAGFLGTRSAFGIAFQMRYAYQMLCRNGMLIGGLGGASSDEADTLGQGDALVVVTQAPYAAATLELARSAAERGAAVIALTDAPTSPILPFARHVLRFARPEDAPGDTGGPASFFHSTAGLLGLAEHLIARVAVLGGDGVLQRLSEIESRQRADGVYWPETPGRPAPSRARR
ncbi:MurR/RpiR family transcriptional regulator [Achromobacter sp. AONIH1]|jgi:DNA-binding MurR/RpiR family transcriptional regulator|uniref:MurR/RpiR family transcriptional regulator n=1 Tax=unclassified Achromobacter TaxID=2626865 RepID=UPI000CD07252|nr:MurR/RpiR family transcriptional regulator [Achromobacter sp. AONIH1]AUT49055.1 silent information regulator protein Sir2 [Achromobacter sp. AONIH1]